MGEQLEKELKELGDYDLEVELKRFNSNVDLDNIFKLPEWVCRLIRFFLGECLPPMSLLTYPSPICPDLTQVGTI